MKILITGASGYIGKQLINKIIKLKDAEVVLLSREKHSFKNNSCHQVVADINNSKIDTLFEKLNFDIVIHCAGYVPKKSNEDDWGQCVIGNVLGTENIINKINFKKFLYISTCEVYGDVTQKFKKINERCSPKPVSNYAKSKLMAEQLCIKLSIEKKFPLCILRMTTVYGNNDSIVRAIPNFIKAAIKNELLMILGKGKNVRDYLHIEDAVLGIISAVRHFKSGIFNISSGQGIKINDLAKLIIKESGSSSKIKYIPSKVIPDRRIFNNRRAIKYLLFHPKISIYEGIKMILPKRKLFIDLDGTLLDISDRWYSLYLEMLKKYNLRVYKKYIYLLMKRSGINEAQIVSKMKLNNKFSRQYVAGRKRLIENKLYLKQDKLKIGTKEMLNKLASKFDLILITLRQKKQNCINEISRLDIKKYFMQVLIAGADMSKAKCITVSYSAIEIMNSWFIGDTEEDLNAARELGIKAVLVCDGARNKKIISGLHPDIMVNSFRDINIDKL